MTGERLPKRLKAEKEAEIERVERMIKEAAHGDKVTYHRGFLLDDCEFTTNPDRRGVALARARREAARRMMHQFHCALVQKRHGFHDYEYIALRY